VLWIAVLVVGAVAVLQFRRTSTPQPAATLDATAIPVAAEYARDLVSAQLCGDARKLEHGSLGDPCKTFEGLHGDKVGAGTVQGDCSAVAARLGSSQAGRLAHAACVRLPVTGKGARGQLSVWLRGAGNGWQVVAAASVISR
jgi:hypothetical protein